MDLSALAIDGLVPSRSETPASAEEVVTLVSAAHRDRTAAVIFGGGTRISVGDAPSRYDVAIDMRGVRGVVEHSPADLVCIVRAGTTLADLAAELARHGQRWPVDVADPERATVGGTIASAATGPSRLRHQHVRDWVIGCEAVLGDGTRVRAGGRVVKNVTGYDLTRLYSGSFGTLAVLVELSLKLVAIDERARTLAVHGDAASLAALGNTLRATLPLDGLVLATGDAAGGGAALTVRVAGGQAAVERVTREIGARGAFAEIDDAAWHALVSLPARTDRVARAAVRPGSESEVLSGSAVAHIGTGSAFVFGERSNGQISALRGRCEATGGALILERASTEQRRALGTWGAPRVPAAIARSLKARFDPHGVLAPGRLPG
ncbi:MAG TPA: FAD-binding protein [Methylomirabilota bacterium]|nr:FAD-binding protein [Methylomirabilota bacterium]